MHLIWEGDLKDIIDTLKLCSIIERIHSWAMNHLRPWISSCIDQWGRVGTEVLRVQTCAPPDCPSRSTSNLSIPSSTSLESPVSAASIETAICVQGTAPKESVEWRDPESLIGQAHDHQHRSLSNARAFNNRSRDHRVSTSFSIETQEPAALTVTPEKRPVLTQEPKMPGSFPTFDVQDFDGSYSPQDTTFKQYERETLLKPQEIRDISDLNARLARMNFEPPLTPPDSTQRVQKPKAYPPLPRDSTLVDPRNRQHGQVKEGLLSVEISQAASPHRRRNSMGTTPTPASKASKGSVQQGVLLRADYQEIEADEEFPSNNEAHTPSIESRHGSLPRKIRTPKSRKHQTNRDHASANPAAMPMRGDAPVSTKMRHNYMYQRLSLEDPFTAQNQRASVTAIEDDDLHRDPSL